LFHATKGRKAEKRSRSSLVDLDQYKPEAPDDLTPEQKQVWCDIVESMKPGSFSLDVSFAQLVLHPHDL
jgi:hypothetical protein